MLIVSHFAIEGTDEPTLRASRLRGMMTQVEAHAPLSVGSPAKAPREARTHIWVATGVLAYFVIKLSWIAEDAFITLRTVDNLLNGFGLRWNVAERVQGYTHPLWMLVLVPFKAVFSSSLLALMVPGWLTAIPAFPLLFRAARTPAGVVVAYCALALSQSVIEFSTSGLESSLSHLLIICVLVTLPSEKGGIGRHLLCFALLLVNRLDLVTLMGPVVALEIWRARSRRQAWKVILSMLPLAAWFVFATIYYGAPLPNTYFAKVASSMPPGSIAAQGLRYILDIILYEPLTLGIVLVGAGLGVTCRRADRPGFHLALGIGLHLIYVLCIGGDFMNARFLTPDVMASAWIAMRAIDRTAPRAAFWADSRRAAVAVMLVSVGLVVADHHSFSSRRAELFRGTRISDERLLFQPATGLWSRMWGYLDGEAFEAVHPWVDLGQQLRRQHPRGTPFVHENMGLLGYHAGPRVHIVDSLGLTDPFMARLPVKFFWTAGHGRREVPEEYVQSLERRRNVIRDPGLHRLFDDITLATRTERLFTAKRFWACWRLNTGYDYRRAGQTEASVGKVTQ